MKNKTSYRFEIYPNQYQKIETKPYLRIPYFMFYSEEEILDIDDIAQDILIDSVTEELVSSVNKSEYLQNFIKKNNLNQALLFDVHYKNGVTDNSGYATEQAFLLHPRLQNKELKIRSGFLYYFLDKNHPEVFIKKELANSLIQEIMSYQEFEAQSNSRFDLTQSTQKNTQLSFLTSGHQFLDQKNSIVNEIDFFQDLNQLQILNKKHCWAFSTDELLFIQDYFKSINKKPTDIEIEIIAQSWSEHCKHKIFASEIEYTEGELDQNSKKLGSLHVKSLFKTYIKDVTEKIRQDRNLNWLISVFHDNAGIVRFDPQLDICIKVETHNSPSALDPYGGALTGILGVNRDILGCGLGAKPIANTNVFCTAESQFFKDHQIQLPEKLLDPDRILKGIHQGVKDGGNKSGIPTVNGAFVYDYDYAGKPLVYCGTVGVIPHTENGLNTFEKRAQVGDLIVMSGGLIGKDGIHGATFSSIEMDETASSSVVQIGDPMTQKRLTDFLLEARQLNLFSSVTDNGAGGLSSSVGEMAQATGGARVHINKAPLKYPGLKPFEIMISESQERMTFAVRPDQIDTFLKLSKSRDVVSTVIGEFTDSGYLEVFSFDQKIASLNLHFLHKALKPMKLKAHYSKLAEIESKKNHWLFEKLDFFEINNKNFQILNLKEKLLNTLSSANVKSHEKWIRQYDHEVKASTVIKPFTGTHDHGFHAPSDAAVIWLRPHGGEEKNAISISCGIAPEIGDCYEMALASVDEAVRNNVSVGGQIDQMVLVDNFCWPDPVENKENPELNLDAQFKLAQLVRANHALKDICLAYGLPLVSGKDSMKNDFSFINQKNKTQKISVKPTLLVTALGRIPDLNLVVTSQIKEEQALIYLIGPESLSDLNLQFKIYQKMNEAQKLKLIQSCHDISNGGLLVCLAEKIMCSRFGISVDLDLFDKIIDDQFLFNESSGRFIVSIANKDQDDFEKLFSKSSFKQIGKTTFERKLILHSKSNPNYLSVTSEECLRSYKCLSDKESLS